MFFDRIKLFIKRFKNSRKFGLFFFGAKNFSVPKKIKLNNKTINLCLPDEFGIKITFIEIFFDDVYELEWIKNFSIKKEIKIESIIDIGGNCGLTSLLFRKYFPDSIINCYEPNYELKKYLDHSSFHGDFNYFIEAVGNKSGKVKLNINNEESILSKISNNKKGSTVLIPFKETLKRFKNKSIDIVKLDCEGSEWEILKDKESWKKVKFLTMEYHLGKNNNDHKRILSFLDDIGFKKITDLSTSNADYGMVLAYNTLKLSI